MDFEVILKVAERRVKAALGKAEEGKDFSLTASLAGLILLCANPNLTNVILKSDWFQGNDRWL